MNQPTDYHTIRAYFETDENKVLDRNLVGEQQARAAKIGAPLDTCFITAGERPVRISEVSHKRQRKVTKLLNQWLNRPKDKPAEQTNLL